MQIIFGNGIQFILYAGKDSQLNEYEDIELDLGVAVAARLVQPLPSQKKLISNSYVIVDNLLLLQSYCETRLQPMEQLGKSNENPTVKINERN